MDVLKPITFSVLQKDLESALKQVSKTPLSPGHCNKNGIPFIYSCIVFILQEKSLHIWASDRDTAIRSEVPVLDQETDHEGAIFAVHHYDILPVVRRLDKQELGIEISGSHMKVSHSFGSFSLPLSNDGIEIFQERIKAMQEKTCTYSLELGTSFLRSALSRLSYAVAKDDLRPMLNGVCVGTGGNQLYFVASDGHTLIRIQKQVQEASLSRFIIPSRSLVVIRHILSGTSSVSMSYALAPEDPEKDNEGIVHVCTDTGTRYWFIPVPGRYPDFTKVIPASFTGSMLVNRNTLAGSLNRLGLFTDVSEAARFQMFQDSLHIKVRDKDFEFEAEESIPATLEGSGQTFGMRIKFILNTLRNIRTENVSIQCEDTVRAFVFSPHPQSETEKVTMLVMPMVMDD